MKTLREFDKEEDSQVWWLLDCSGNLEIFIKMGSLSLPISYLTIQ